MTRKVINSFNSQRSGDVFIVLDQFAVPSSSDTETTHGSPWNYDAQVPLLLWGSGFKPGTYTQPCQPIDLAPSIAAALGLTQPSGATGMPLSIALAMK
jgi:predicted AlkP superfamily pyrophosphatase or phosphodiesterase